MPKNKVRLRDGIALGSVIPDAAQWAKRATYAQAIAACITLGIGMLNYSGIAVSLEETKIETVASIIAVGLIVVGNILQVITNPNAGIKGKHCNAECDHPECPLLKESEQDDG